MLDSGLELFLEPSASGGHLSREDLVPRGTPTGLLMSVSQTQTWYTATTYVLLRHFDKYFYSLL